MTIVRIGREVSCATLESALVNAAKELKWKVKVENSFRREYRSGSVHENSVYDGKSVSISGRLLPALNVAIPRRDPMDYFFVYSGIYYGGFAGKRKIRKYLSAVSRNLSNS